MLGIPLRLAINAIILALRGLEWFLLWPFVLLRARRRRFVRFDLKGPFVLAPPRGLAALFGKDRSYATFDRELRHIERNRSVEGIVLRIKAPSLGLTDAALLRQRLEALRQQGKRAICTFESAGTTAMTVAGGADTVMIVPAGRIYLTGLAFELTFLRDLLARLGVRAQFIHIGRYKTAGHMFSRSGPTEAQQKMMTALLDDLTETLTSLVRRSGDGPPPWLDQPSLTASQARRLGLVDHQAFADQVAIRLRAERADPPFDPLGTFADEGRIAEHTKQLKALPPVDIVKRSVHQRQRPRPLRLRPLWGRRPEIHVVEMSGMILPDEASSGPLAGRAHINPAAVRRVLGQLRRNDAVKAVVLAIDSRGGSALASDLIWREVRRLVRKKPVVAVMRAVAASGGYYIAVGAHEVIAHEATLTGSIGVVAGKVSGADLLDNADVHTRTLRSGPFATLLSPRHPWSDAEVDALRQDIRRSYRRFINRVATGRQMRARRVHLLARGRVYSGRLAARMGLVDGLGTVQDGIERAAIRAELDVERVRVRYHVLHSPGLRQILAGTGATEPAWWRTLTPHADDVLSLLLLLRSDPVLAYFDGAIELGSSA